MRVANAEPPRAPPPFQFPTAHRCRSHSNRSTRAWYSTTQLRFDGAGRRLVMGGRMSEEAYIVRLLDECREEIRVSDSKASIIFAAVSAAAAVLSSLLLDSTQTLRTSGAAVTAL